MYKLSITGSKTDPCGTQKGRFCGQDIVPDMLILWCLSKKYDLNTQQAVPEMPTCL